MTRTFDVRRAQIERRGKKHGLARPADDARQPRCPAVHAALANYVVHRRQRRRTGKRTKQQMSIRLNAGEDVKDFLVEKGYDEKYGARPLRRTIQNLVEDKLAEAVLEGRVREGDSVKLLLKDGQLKFSARHPQTARKQDGVVV